MPVFTPVALRRLPALAIVVRVWRSWRAGLAAVPAAALVLAGRLPIAAAVPIAAWAVHSLATLPPVGVSYLLLAASIAAIVFVMTKSLDSRLDQPARFIMLFVFAVALFGLRAQWALQARLPAGLEGITLSVAGHVADAPRAMTYGIGFDMVTSSCKTTEPEAAALSETWCAEPRRLRLVWPGHASAQNLRPGSRWVLTVRLKRPHGLVNPGGFDSELRALEEGVTARGYVREPGTAASRDSASKPLQLKGDYLSPMVLIHRARLAVVARMSAALQNWSSTTRGTLVALVTGEQSAIPSLAWQDFNRTGTSHLMSISGLHVTLFAALAMVLARFVLRLPRILPVAWLLRVPAPAIVMVLGVTAAFGYTLFSGAGIPAQRTTWMLAVGAFAALSGRTTALAPVMALAAAVVTALDPWAPLAGGFWLSFAAVAAIVSFGSGIRPRRDPWWLAAFRTQWAATLALVPLGAIWFGAIPLLGPIANAVAIPLISGVITPLALLAAALQPIIAPLGNGLLQVIAWPTDCLLSGLARLSAWPMAIHVTGQPSLWLLAPAILGTVLLLIPSRPVPRTMGALLVIPMLVLPPDRVTPGTWRVLAMDVGQGTAILVRTAQHALLFDSGPVYEAESGAGNRVVMPVLHGLGISRLDAMVLSHQDSDHVGGAELLMTAFDVPLLLSSIAPEHRIVATFAQRHRRCERGDAWTWDGVHFEMLHPGPPRLDHSVNPASKRASDRSKPNGRSCALRISGPGGSILLTGDIERVQEKELGAVLGSPGLQADVLVAPHHGSATSSSTAFLDLVAPRWAVFQMGYSNRYRHPARAVLRRYEERGIERFMSDRDGAVEFRFAEGQAPRVITHRRLARPYWRIDVP